MAVSNPPDSESNSSSGKSYPHFFFKFIIILFIIVLLPFFPSQPPESLNNSLFTSYWEILQLFFIGIVVSYGLFSTRTDVSMNTESYPNTDITQTYLSGISQLSSIFENKVENISGFDEKRGTQNSYYQGLNEDSVSVIVNGYKKSGTSIAHQVFDKLPKPSPRSSFGYKPLGLPIRSLSVRDTECDYSDASSASESSSGMKEFSECVDKIDKDEIRGLAPVNLEEKFEETVVCSPIPWGSRSCKMQKKEGVGSFEFNSSELRPFSVGKSEPESVKPQPYRLPKSPRVSLKDSKLSHTTSKDSKGSSVIFSSVSPAETKLSSPSSVPSENDVSPNARSNTKEFSNMNAKRGFKGNSENFSKNKKVPEVVETVNFDGKSNKYDSISKAPSGSLKDPKFSYATSKESSSVYSSLSSIETKLPSPSVALSKIDEPHSVNLKSKEFSKSNAKKGIKGNLGELSKNKVCEVVDSVNLDAESNTFEAVSKGKSRGKSVRTVRPNYTFVEATKTDQLHPIQDEKPQPISPGKKYTDNFSYEPNSSILNYRKGQRQVLADNTTVESERESESDLENPEASSDDEEWDEESDPGEVDKKASEFIAKFKEQIRLQRVRLYL